VFGRTDWQTSTSGADVASVCVRQTSVNIVAANGLPWVAGITGAY